MIRSEQGEDGDNKAYSVQSALLAGQGCWFVRTNTGTRFPSSASGTTVATSVSTRRGPGSECLSTPETASSQTCCPLWTLQQVFAPDFANEKGSHRDKEASARESDARQSSQS